ncbi:MAG: tetratricopeptide repeat protein [Candidatus Melainabacteria bacterium]
MADTLRPDNTISGPACRFVSPQVIQRLQDGRFVPERRSKPAALTMADRRDTVSPLAVAKHCLRYEPRVFRVYRPEILHLVHALNNPDCKMVMIGGDQGTGKSSLMRGVIELMGGGAEQLLWFDANRHTDYEEIIRFLVNYIPYVCAQESNPLDAHPDNDPFERLNALLGHIAGIPLLLVIDNTEFIVDGQLRFESQPFKEVLNFLLSFPNIKMVLIGQRLPHADMGSSESLRQGRVVELKLGGLKAADATAWLSHAPLPLTPDAIDRLVQRAAGYPWLLKAFLFLLVRGGVSVADLLARLDEPEEASPVAVVLACIGHSLSPVERKLLCILTLVRHPVDSHTLMTMARRAFPNEADLFDPRWRTGDALTENGMLRPVVRQMVPPQAVLDLLHQRQLQRAQSPFQLTPSGNAPSFQPAYEIYDLARKTYYRQLSEFEQHRLHGVLYDFYLQEREKPERDRISGLKTTALIQETRFHAQRGRIRRENNPVPLTPTTLPFAASQGFAATGWGVPPTPGYDARDTGHEAAYTHDDEDLAEAMAGFGEPVPPFPSGSAPGHPVLRAWPADAPAQPQGYPESHSEGHWSPEELALLWGRESNGERDAGAPPPSERPEDQTPDYPAAAPQAAEPQTTSVSDTEKAIQQRLAAAAATHHPAEMLRQLEALGAHRMDLGDYDRAEESFKKALTLLSKIPPGELTENERLTRTLSVRQQLGACFHQTHRDHDARLCLTQVVGSADAGLSSLNGDGQRAVIFAHRDLASLADRRGEAGVAVTHYRAALNALAQNREPTAAWREGLAAELEFRLAAVLEDADRWPEALEAYQASFDLDQAAGNAASCAATRANMAGLLHRMGRTEDALNMLQEALQWDQRAGNREGQWQTLLTLGRWQAQRGDFRQALQIYNQALALALAESNALWQANLYLKRGDLYMSLRDWDNALRAFQAADSLSRSGQVELSEDSNQTIRERLEEVSHVIRQQSPQTGP